MNATQQRYLLNRLDEAKRGKPGQYDSLGTQVPAAVKRAKAKQAAAEKVIKTWRIGQDKLRAARNKKIREAFDRAKSVIMFKDSKSALTAVEWFEQLKF